MKAQEKAAHKQDQARRKARKNQALTHAQRAKLHTLVTARLFGPEQFGQPSFGNTDSDLLAYKIQLKINDEFLKYTKPKQPLISEHNKKLLFERLGLENKQVEEPKI